MRRWSLGAGGRRGDEGRERPLAIDVRDRGRQRRDRDDADAFDRGRFGRVHGGDDDLVEARLPRCERQAEDSANGPDLAIQSKLADEETPRGRRRREAADLEQRHGHGQVERGADFLESGRREVHRDRAAGRREAAVPQRGADALARFPDARVRQPDDVEAGEPRGDVDLHVEDTGVDSQNGSGMDSGKHVASSVRGEACGGMRTTAA